MCAVVPSLHSKKSMDVLCTDKTGTLTEGVIRLDSCVDPQGVGSPEVRRLALLNSAFQSGMKNPLDDAVTATIAAGEISPDARKLAEIPYDFSRKRLSVIVAGKDRPPLLICKGAATNVIDVCAAVMLRARLANDPVSSALHTTLFASASLT